LGINDAKASFFWPFVVFPPTQFTKDKVAYSYIGNDKAHPKINFEMRQRYYLYAL
jgi:hypothetical protein